MSIKRTGLKTIVGQLDENENTEGHPFLVYVSLL